MIEVAVTKDGVVLAHMKIERIGPRLAGDDFGNYIVRANVELGGHEVGLYRRVLTKFKRRKTNVLGLVMEAIKALGPGQLEMEENWSEEDTQLMPVIEARSNNAI